MGKVLQAIAHERELADKLENEGWHVERVAASGRRENSVCDLVGIKDGVPYLIEVKTTWDDVFRVPQDQISRLIETSLRCRAIPLLAVLFKRRGWKFLELNEIPKVVRYEKIF